MKNFEGNLFDSFGTLKYFLHEGKYKLILEVDQQLADFYFNLIPDYVDVNRQKYPAHVSVVRNEIPVNLDEWGKYEGKEIEFIYSNYVNEGTVYFWLNVFSKDLEKIRLELGLPVNSIYTLPPEGFVKCFHMTIGNKKKVP